MAKRCYINNREVKAIALGSPNTNCLTYIPNDIKLDLDPLDVTVVGSPTINNGVVSGFSNANYLTLPGVFNPLSTPWEEVICFTTGSDLTTEQTICCNNVPYWGYGVTVVNGKIQVCLSNSTSSFAMINNQTITASANTRYYVKMTFNGSNYTSTYSTNGVTWLNIFSLDSTKTIVGNTRILGTNDGKKYPFKGSIDLSQSYIRVNGSSWWQGGTGILTLKKGSKVYIPNGNSELKYYKYTGVSWTQPKMTSNTVAVAEGNIVITATSGSSGGTKNYPYQAMDGTKSGNSFWEVNVKPSWWQVKFPYRLRILGVKYYKANNDDNNTTSVAFYTSSNKNHQIGSTLSTSGSAWAGFSVSNIPSQGIITDTLYLELLTSTGGYTSIGEIEIQAEKITGEVESTADDYDYAIPGGTPLFKELVTNKDLITTTRSALEFFIFVTEDGSGLDVLEPAHCQSGTSIAPLTYSVVYDTSINRCNLYITDVSNPSRRVSFPICICSGSGGGFKSIDKVFNGFGYIGNTVFALPDVKGLIPNGFNEDGTYKSIERIVDKVLTYTYPSTSIWTRSKQPLFIAKTGEQFSGTSSDNYFTGADKSIYNDKTYVTFYSTTENIMYHAHETAGGWVDYNCFFIGYTGMELGKITSLTPQPVQPENTFINIDQVYKGSQLIWGYEPSTVLFKSSTPGTYTLNITTPGYYNVTVVGGGSGGAYVYSSKFSDGRAAGGSGAGFQGIVYLNSGNHTIKVGAGGAGLGYNSNGQSSATSTAGGASSIDSIVVAGGAGAAKAGIHGAAQTGGAGGTLTYTSSAVQSYTLAKNGNTGATIYNSNLTGAASVLTGTTYGAGGDAGHNITTAGKNGYVLITTI